MGIKKFIGNIGSNLKRPEKETLEGNINEINRMRNTPVYSENPYVRTILDLGINLENVSFGTKFLPSSDSIYKKFKTLGQGEVIIAAMQSKGIVGGLFVRVLMLVTDKAIYTTENRFPMEELCRYIAIISDNDGYLYLHNQNGKYYLFGKSLTAATKAKSKGSALKLVKELQKVAINNIETGKKIREDLSAWVVSVANAEIEDGNFSQDTMLMMESMLETDIELRYSVGKCFFRYAVNTCDTQVIENSVSRLLQIPSGLDEIKIVGLCKKEIDNYADRVKNSEIDLKDSYVRRAYKNLCTSIKVEHDFSGVEKSVVREIIDYALKRFGEIQPYLLVRADLSCTVSELCSQVGIKNYLDEGSQSFIQYAIACKNKKMTAVYQAVLDNEKLPEECLNWVDGFGLDPLHYSIILHNHNMVSYLCDNGKIRRQFQNDINEEAFRICEYGTVAVLAGEEDLLDKLVLQSEEVQSLKENKKQLERLLQLKNVSLDLSKTTLRRSEDLYRKARHTEGLDPSKLDDYKYKIENLKDKIREYEEDIRELKNDILDVEIEIKSCSDYLCRKYHENADIIRNAKPSVPWFYKQLYTEPELLYKILSHGLYDGHIFIIENVVYFIPTEYAHRIHETDDNRGNQYKENYQKTEDSYKQASQGQYKKEYQYQQKKQEDQVKQNQGDKRFKKPYGNHWFSEAAHRDIKVMRSEYKKLVIKYHPDNNPDGLEAFKDIQEEKNTILKQFGDDEK